MDNCRHVYRLSPSRDHSILNPQKWLCAQCGTTESVWVSTRALFTAPGQRALKSNSLAWTTVHDASCALQFQKFLLG